MGLIGNLYDYGTPMGWAGKAGKKLGVMDKSFGDHIESGLDSLDRSGKAEEMYGGVNAKGMEVPHFASQYGNYGQMANRYAGQGSSFRGDQQNLGNILAAEASGNGVGQRLVGMQARQAADRASAQQFGAVAGARPGMQAMASRNAMLGSAMAQSAVGEQAAMGSAQMTLGAQQAYGQHLSAARGQDIGQQQANNSAELAAYEQRLKLAGLQQNGAMTAEQLRAERYKAIMGAPTKGEAILGGRVTFLGDRDGASEYEDERGNRFVVPTAIASPELPTSSASFSERLATSPGAQRSPNIVDRRAEETTPAPSAPDALLRGMPQTRHETEKWLQHQESIENYKRTGQPQQPTGNWPDPSVRQANDPAGIEAERVQAAERAARRQQAVEGIRAKLGRL